MASMRGEAGGAQLRQVRIHFTHHGGSYNSYKSCSRSYSKSYNDFATREGLLESYKSYMFFSKLLRTKNNNTKIHDGVLVPGKFPCYPTVGLYAHMIHV
jgi:hypothetical protein